GKPLRVSREWAPRLMECCEPRCRVLADSYVRRLSRCGCWPHCGQRARSARKWRRRAGRAANAERRGTRRAPSLTSTRCERGPAAASIATGNLQACKSKREATARTVQTPLPPALVLDRKKWLHFRPPPVDFCGSRLAIGAATERARAPASA